MVGTPRRCQQEQLEWTILFWFVLCPDTQSFLNGLRSRMRHNMCGKFKYSQRVRPSEEQMSFRSLTAAVALYRSGALTLEQAAERGGVSTTKMESALRSRGIAVREEVGAGSHERTVPR